MTPKIRVEPLATGDLKPKTVLQSPEQLGFGIYFTDRMFMMTYEHGEWKDAVIKKYGIIPLEPSAAVFHYGQEIFEGQKAFKQDNGRTVLFRPEKNIDRFNHSADRMCMPILDDNIFLEAEKTLVRLEKDWIPTAPESSLYIRPTLIAIDPVLGVHPSNKYLFYIILSPSGTYFKDGFKPVKIHVTKKYVRAAPGGIGFAKTGGNYASSLRAIGEAKEKYGASQVLFLDAIQHKYIEEAGSMNIFVVKDGMVYTPPLDEGTILAGVTRESVIQLCHDMNIPVREEALAIDDIVKSIINGTITECFGSGTAAVIAPIGELIY